MDAVYFGIFLSFLAGLSTALGACVVFCRKGCAGEYLPFYMGFSAGAMIYISFAEILNGAVQEIGLMTANVAFFFGIALAFFVERFLPHQHFEGIMCNGGLGKKRMLLKTGMVVAIGLALHNIPEGLAVFLTSAKETAIAIPLAIAIAIHNIPEGIAVSVPIFHATGSRKKAFIISALSGFAEPLGAILGFVFLYPFLTPYILNLSLACVAGVMVFVSFDEIIPRAMRRRAEEIEIFGIVLGMVVMALSIILLRQGI
ncbi:MAG: zinc transporter ZupT [Candidatus Anstonellales archaeon]